VPITPLVKLGAAPDGKPFLIQALIYSTHIRSAPDVEKAVTKDKIQGMVINQIESLGSKERKLLQDSYPATDFNRCIIFELDRKPGSGTAVVYLGVAVAAILVGVLILFARFRSSSASQ